ncbi:MAG: RNA-guided endonuclease InsQ/TnpB family protein [Promethearchaeota archaeon]
MLKKHETYKVLPAQTSQQILRLVIKNWKSYWRSSREYQKDPRIFLGKPKIPQYKKKDGESIVIFTNQNTRIKDDMIYFPKSTNLPPLKTRIPKYQQIRIIPKARYYIFEIVYNREELDLSLDQNRILSLDLGITNILTTANNIGLPPLIVKGNVVKSINQWYNKVRSLNRAFVNPIHLETRKMAIQTMKRNNRIKIFFHKTSRKLINYCITNNLGTIIIGYNELWKHQCNMGRKTNQAFISIPHYQLINMIQYKAKLIGIQVIITEESYTSKCSALDFEPIEKQHSYLGKRIKRGLFQSSKGIKINADVNGAINIMRKVIPSALTGKGIEAMVLSPKIVKII